MDCILYRSHDCSAECMLRSTVSPFALKSQKGDRKLKLIAMTAFSDDTFFTLLHLSSVTLSLGDGSLSRGFGKCAWLVSSGNEFEVD